MCRIFIKKKRKILLLLLNANAWTTTLLSFFSVIVFSYFWRVFFQKAFSRSPSLSWWQKGYVVKHVNQLPSSSLPFALCNKDTNDGRAVFCGAPDTQERMIGGDLMEMVQRTYKKEMIWKEKTEKISWQRKRVKIKIEKMKKLGWNCQWCRLKALKQNETSWHRNNSFSLDQLSAWRNFFVTEKWGSGRLIFLVFFLFSCTYKISFVFFFSIKYMEIIDFSPFCAFLLIFLSSLVFSVQFFFFVPKFCEGE